MLLPAITLLALAALPQNQEYVVFSKTSPSQKVAFDWTGRTTDGLPATVEKAVFVFRVHPVPSPPLPATVVSTASPPKAGENEYLVKDLTGAVAPGKYTLKVQIKDTAGRFSGFSNVMFVEVIAGAGPAAPTDLKEK